MGEAGIALRGVDFAGEFKEHLFEELWIEDFQRIGKTTETHLPWADIILHAIEMTRCAKTTHSVDCRIEQTEEKKTEIVLFEQQSLETTRLSFALEGGGLGFGKPRAEINEQFPTSEFLLGQSFPWRGARAKKSETSLTVKLRIRHPRAYVSTGRKHAEHFWSNP